MGLGQRLTIRFASWNVGRPSPERLRRQLELLVELHCDLVALQEMSGGNCVAARAWGGFPTVLSGLDVRPPLAGETTARDRGCAILLSAHGSVAGPASVLEDAAAPERSLCVPVTIRDRELSVGSFHQVAASDRKKWGPAMKAQTFRAMARWFAVHNERTIAGMDVNSPRTDHPDIARNVYFYDRRPGDQDEHLLHDPERATHRLQDAYRMLLRRRPDELMRIREERPDGPLQVSHVVRGQARRFDFIYVSPDVEVVDARYLTDALVAGPKGRLADHALVVADLNL